VLRQLLDPERLQEFVTTIKHARRLGTFSNRLAETLTTQLLR
jgi:DNA-binding MurR/RpiR family transcriptional regulator